MLLISVFTTAAFCVQSAKVNQSSCRKTVQATDSDWWPMFHHDLAHSGYSTSTAPATNQTLWTYKTGQWVFSSPAVSGGVVYVGSFDDNVYALNATTGVLVWKYATGGDVESSPAVAGGVVYVGSIDENVYALNATTGALVWKYATRGYVDSSPAVSGGVVYVGSEYESSIQTEGYVYALNATTGALVWRYTTGSNVYSSPAVSGGVVYVGSEDENVYALNATTGALVWKYKTGSGVFSPPAVAGGVVYVGSLDDYFYALNATTGALMWKYETGSSVSSSPAVSGGVVYVGSFDDNVYALNATTGVLVWKYATGGDVESSPAVAGGMVFIGSDDHNVYALNATTGAPVWKYTTGNSAANPSSPAVANGVVYVGSSDDNVYAFGTQQKVSFVESGLPLGAQWFVTFNGQTQSATSNSVTFNITNGVYPFSVTPPAGYDALPSSGGVIVNGADIVKQITFIFTWWPTFRHDSAHTGFSTSAGPNTNQVLWIYNTGAAVDSSPSVANGMVFIATEWASYSVYALDAATGVPIWSYKTGGSFSSPAVSNAIVYIGSDNGSVFALKETNGGLVWSYKTGGTVISSPAVAHDVVYVGSEDDNVYALNATTGTLVWKYATNSEVDSSPAVANGVVYIGSDGDSVYALNATTGTLLWSYRTGDLVNSSPAVANGIVYIGSMDDNVYAFNATTGTVLWSYKTSSSVESSPSVVSGVVYSGSDNGEFCALNATTGTLIWTLTLGNAIVSSPAVAGGLVYVDSLNGMLYALNATTGAAVWYYRGGFLISSPAIAYGVVYIGSFSGEIYAFGPPIPVSIWPLFVVLDVGQSQTFTSTAEYGTPPYSFQWYLNGVAVSGATNDTWTYTASNAGAYTVYVKATDAAANVQTSESAAVTVNAALSVTISPKTVVLDSGQSQVFTAGVSGGTYPFTYQWYLNGVAVSGANGSTWAFTLSSSGSYNVYVNITDAVDVVATSDTTTVNVNQALSVSILPSRVTMDVGQSRTFSSTITGGTAPFSYQWYLDGSAVSTNATWTFIPLTYTGQFNVYVIVTDSATTHASATSNTGNVTLNPQLAVMISPLTSTIYLDQNQTYTSSVGLTGTPPYSYQWYLNGTLVSGATSSAWTFTPATNATYKIYVKIADGVGEVATSLPTATLTVIPAIPEFPQGIPLILLLSIASALILALTKRRKPTET
jgi:outer membrane protein assembly factor BamB